MQANELKASSPSKCRCSSATRNSATCVAPTYALSERYRLTNRLTRRNTMRCCGEFLPLPGDSSQTLATLFHVSFENPHGTPVAVASVRAKTLPGRSMSSFTWIDYALLVLLVITVIALVTLIGVVIAF